MSKNKLKSEEVKSMISKSVSVKIAPITKRLGSVEETLEAMQSMLKAISARLNIPPDNPAFEALNSGLESDPIRKAAIENMSAVRASNPLIFPDNRKKVQRVFAKRGFKQGDTVESVLKEAQGE